MGQPHAGSIHVCTHDLNHCFEISHMPWYVLLKLKMGEWNWSIFYKLRNLNLVYKYLIGWLQSLNEMEKANFWILIDTTIYLISSFLRPMQVCFFISSLYRRVSSVLGRVESQTCILWKTTCPWCPKVQNDLELFYTSAYGYPRPFCKLLSTCQNSQWPLTCWQNSDRKQTLVASLMHMIASGNGSSLSYRTRKIKKQLFKGDWTKVL